jgi:ATP-dependent RNA helicase RhlE
VATIGRLLEVAGKGYIDLSKCECLLIDEADKFKMGGSEVNVWQDLSHVIESVPKSAFKAVFSATYKPAQIEAFRKLFGEA